MKKGEFTIIIGPMYSGKTEELIRQVHRYKAAELGYLVFGPENSKYRYNELGDKLCSKSGVCIDNVHWIKTDENGILEMTKIILKHQDNLRVIGIDEIQFFTLSTYIKKTPEEVSLEVPYIWDLIELLTELGFNVIAAGLAKSYRGDPFSPGMAYLITVADKIITLRSICDECKREGKIVDAIHSQRILINEHGERKPASYDDSLVVVGSKDLYEARCKDHFEVRKKPKSEFRKTLEKILSDLYQ